MIFLINISLVKNSTIYFGLSWILSLGGVNLSGICPITGQISFASLFYRITM